MPDAAAITLGDWRDYERETSTTMNVRRGLMRLWVVGSALFILAIAALHGPEIVDEFRATQLPPPPAVTPKGTPEAWPNNYVLLVPYDCAEARGQIGQDYDQVYGGYATLNCWYQFPKFRALYPEYNNEDDETLSKKLYQKIGPPLDFGKLAIEAHLQTGWSLLKKWGAIALGGPFATLILGVLVTWVIVGFRRKPVDDRN